MGVNGTKDMSGDDDGRGARMVVFIAITLPRNVASCCKTAEAESGTFMVLPMASEGIGHQEERRASIELVLLVLLEVYDGEGGVIVMQEGFIVISAASGRERGAACGV